MNLLKASPLKDSFLLTDDRDESLSGSKRNSVFPVVVDRERVSFLIDETLIFYLTRHLIFHVLFLHWFGGYKLIATNIILTTVNG